jgi:hypothetical protein
MQLSQPHCEPVAPDPEHGVSASSGNLLLQIQENRQVPLGIKIPEMQLRPPRGPW